MTIVRSLLLAACILGHPCLTLAADPVDLSGKKGVVDPKDLKKHDPPPPKLDKAPPPPLKAEASEKKAPGE